MFFACSPVYQGEHANPGPSCSNECYQLHNVAPTLNDVYHTYWQTLFYNNLFQQGCPHMILKSLHFGRSLLFIPTYFLTNQINATKNLSQGRKRDFSV